MAVEEGQQDSATVRSGDVSEERGEKEEEATEKEQKMDIVKVQSQSQKMEIKKYKGWFEEDGKRVEEEQEAKTRNVMAVGAIWEMLMAEENSEE